VKGEPVDEELDKQIDAVEEAMTAMTRALHKLQCYSPSMDAGALNYSLMIAIRMEKAAGDLKASAQLLRETNINWMAHKTIER